MKFFTQILLLILSWFANLVSATPVFTKVAMPTYAYTFSETDRAIQDQEIKIRTIYFARSRVSEKLAYQRGFLRESYALERIARAGNVRVVQGAGSFVNQIDNTLARLTNKAKFELLNTGEYKIVGGHHPMAKKAFEGDLVYDYKKAFSVKPSELDKAAGITNVHPSITGQQNSLYTSWKNANPNTKITVDVMADIEIQAMKNVGIPEDVATGWVVKSLEDLKAQGVTEIKNIPWNGTN